MKTPKKVLIVKLGALGDVVHTTIIPSAIKLADPDCEIHYLTSKFISQILENNPLIDKVYKWDRHSKGIKQVLSLAKEFSGQKYDVIFNLTHALRTYLISYLSLPKRVVTKKEFSDCSWVESYFLLAKSIFKTLQLPEKLSLTVSDNEYSKISKQTEKFPKPYIAIAPAGYADKNRQGRMWNIKNWQILVDKIKAEYGGTIFVCGSEDEVELHKNLNGVVLYSGKLTIKESLALLSLTDLVISGDTGLAHIASALDKNVLMLTGSTSPDKIKPFGEKGYYVDSTHSCKHCWKKQCRHPLIDERYTPCMEAITPNMVLDKINQYKLL